MHLTLEAGILHKVLLHQHTFSTCMSASFIIGGHAAMHSLHYCFFILWCLWCLWTEQAAHKHITAECCASLPTFPPSSCLSSRTWTPLDQAVWVAGRSQFAQAEAAQEDRQKAKSAAELGCFSKGEIITFFSPFKKILVKGVLVENGKTELCSCACDQVWLQTEEINVLSVSARATVKATGKVEAFSH